MKVSVDIDCTPAEAREFFGLPDVRPLQERLMQEMQDQMLTRIRAMQPEEMMKLWLPASMKGFDQMQEFFSQMAGNKRE